MRTAVAARGVSVAFGGVAALRDVTVTVERGEVVGLIGPNGAGKTTLVNVIAGVVRPDAGRVELDGEDVTTSPAHRRARLGLRRMFQYGGLVSDETVTMNLLIAHHAVAGDAADRSTQFLERLGISADASRVVRDLPAGTARIVELACVLAGDPMVMLLDEPSAGLSGAETQVLADAIRRHHEGGDHGCLVVAHDMRFVMAVADRIVVLADGCVAFDGSADDARADANVRRLYLGADA